MRKTLTAALAALCMLVAGTAAGEGDIFSEMTYHYVTQGLSNNVKGLRRDIWDLEQEVSELERKIEELMGIVDRHCVPAR